MLGEHQTAYGGVCAATIGARVASACWGHPSICPSAVRKVRQHALLRAAARARPTCHQTLMGMVNSGAAGLALGSSAAAAANFLTRPDDATMR